MLQNGRKCLFQNPSCSVKLAEPLVKTPTPLFEIRSMLKTLRNILVVFLGHFTLDIAQDNFFGGQNIFELKTVIFVALSIEYDFSSQKCLKSSARTKLLVENIQNSTILLLTYVRT